VNLAEFYDTTPVERHHEIVISGDRLFFAKEEFVICPDGELRLVHSHKDIEGRLARIEEKLGIK